jgi:GDPmannose 4,6-dehydratase
LKSALIIGSAGQDGTLLKEYLKTRAMKVFEMTRSALLSDGEVLLTSCNIIDRVSARTALFCSQPEFIYYLAAHHGPAELQETHSFLDTFERSHLTHVVGLMNVLDWMGEYRPTARLFYAASSHCFGSAPHEVQNEASSMEPNDPYGITKTAGLSVCRAYRDKCGLHASVGILYNHESPLRDKRYFSKKVVRAAIEIALGYRDHIELGPLSQLVDWGYAVDYVEAMSRILCLSYPDDFIIATGKAHTVEDFVRIAFECLDLDWRRYTSANAKNILPLKPTRIGDSTKMRLATGWSPSVSFTDLIVKLVDAEKPPNGLKAKA